MLKHTYTFIKIIFAVTIVSLFFIGCGGHMVNVGKLPKKTEMIQDIVINAPKTLFGEGRINKANIFAIEVSALATIKNGYNYFSIDLPEGIVSNVHGSLINTTKDYIEACNTNSFGKDLGMGLLTLGLFEHYSKDNCYVSNNIGIGKLRIISFKKQPLNFTSYNAKDVIKYLKESALYINIPKGEYTEYFIKNK